MQFSIDELMELKVTHINKGVEFHGNELKHRKDINWRYEGPNTFLDKFPGLRAALYYGDPTQDIPGVEAVTPHLRGKMLKGPFGVKFDGTGYLLTIEDGPVSGASFQLFDSDLNNVKVDPIDGGSSVVTWRTQHTGLDAETMGRIDVIDGKTVRMMAAPPDLQDGTQPERMTKAQLKAKAKADEAAKNQSPFKFSAGDKGGITDNNPPAPPPPDPNAPTAGDIFATKVANGETAAAKKKPGGGKVITLAKGGRVKPRTGKGN